ncbi:hypothetical protein PIB30_066241, partial [Stylosanthes scabra]|nr:hypothetical protein [Stylosanthes scabra]
MDLDKHIGPNKDAEHILLDEDDDEFGDEFEDGLDSFPSESKGGGGRNGTSSLKSHMKICRELPRYHDLGKMMIDEAGRLRAR